jgi:hypothetical protein
MVIYLSLMDARIIANNKMQKKRSGRALSCGGLASLFIGLGFDRHRVVALQSLGELNSLCYSGGAFIILADQVIYNAFNVAYILLPWVSLNNFGYKLAFKQSTGTYTILISNTENTRFR